MEFIIHPLDWSFLRLRHWSSWIMNPLQVINRKSVDPIKPDTKSFPDGFKTTRIFLDHFPFSGQFQNCVDFSGWLAIDDFKTVRIFPYAKPAWPNDLKHWSSCKSEHKVKVNDMIIKIIVLSYIYYLALYCLALHCIILYCICFVLYCIVLYCVVLYFIVLYYSSRSWNTHSLAIYYKNYQNFHPLIFYGWGQICPPPPPPRVK